MTSDDYYGGVCLDSLDEIPQNYKDILTIGKNVIIKTGTILCGDGFEYDANLKHISHQNGLQIGDNVHIGSLCVIDRGIFWDTIISEGTKIGNHVNIGHGVIIGKNCIIESCVNILPHIKIGDNVRIRANTLVDNNI